MQQIFFWQFKVSLVVTASRDSNRQHTLHRLHILVLLLIFSVIKKYFLLLVNLGLAVHRVLPDR